VICKTETIPDPRLKIPSRKEMIERWLDKLWHVRLNIPVLIFPVFEDPDFRKDPETGCCVA